ncbi:hypothetical protein Gpo141_00002970 [Globisporangium polare]
MELSATTLDQQAAAAPLQALSAGVAHVAEGVTMGFKALPSASLPATYSSPQDGASPELDWAGIYPQLSFAQAVAYLPNQFERGCKIAHIVKLTTKKPLVVVSCSDPRFMDGSLSSSVKVRLVRDAIKTLDASVLEPLRDDLPLMNACGEREIVLCIPDAEGFELVVPKALFTDEWLACELLFTFHESERLPAMVGKVEQQPQLHRSVLLDWDQLTQTLETHAAELRCTQLERAIAQSLYL